MYNNTAGKAGGSRSQTNTIRTIHSHVPRPRLRSACRHPSTILQSQTVSSPDRYWKATKITILNGKRLHYVNHINITIHIYIYI